MTRCLALLAVFSILFATTSKSAPFSDSDPRQSCVIQAEKGFYDKAEKFCRKVLRSNPDDSEIWDVMGFIYEERGLSAKAAEFYEKSLKINPGSAETLHLAGVAYEAQGLYPKAIEFYEKAVQANPDFAEAWNDLGFLYAMRGRHAKAIECFSEALRVDPEYTEAWENMARAYASKPRPAQAENPRAKVKHKRENQNYNREQYDKHQEAATFFRLFSSPVDVNPYPWR
ncbi:tetratricopeptide repeat protein [Candidatus Mycalebacterium sp.]